MSRRSTRRLRESDVPAVRRILRQHTEEDWWRGAIRRIREWVDDPERLCLAVEAADGTVVAFAVGIVHPRGTSPEDFAVTDPGEVDYPDGPLLLLKYNYVDEDHHGQGIGTRLVRERVRWAVAEYGIAAAFCECWVMQNHTSSDELLEKLGFTREWYTDDYYAEYNQSTSGVCSGCDRQLSNCQCGGAIYLHRSPADV